ncbi:transglutaminase domain-containing protein [Antarcticibacterium flavum]|uniref:Transglutaminase domain-containing protein n=2 Tax=Flavobacteriaceae TaxID=49546 RepID=A0A5B7X988_9FLAO|nr:transglutaminase [Antarcticibacterium sp. W02-3]QCY71362.1 transglutaminase domain-containing protein [Antarcticibacterium flavum]
MKNASLDPFLKPTEFLDSGHPAVQEFVEKHTSGFIGDVEKLEALYYAVRDGFRYDPYRLDFSREAMRASHLTGREYGYCVEKSGLFAAAARVIGVPARMGFANVRNHIGTARLEEVLQTNVLVFHGFAEVYIGGRWIKMTPVFNKELCERLGVAPLEFNAHKDVIFQEFDRRGGKFMEYLHDYGRFEDIPYEFFMSELQRHYPHLREEIGEGRLIEL